MKKFLVTLVIVMTMSFVGLDASAATPESKTSSLAESLWKSLPQTLVVKQEAMLDNGQTFVVYYKKTGDQCEVYSPNNVSDLTINDLINVKSSDFGITSSVKGKRIFAAPFSRVRKMLKNAVINYL